MSASEILSRVQVTLHTKLEKQGFFRARPELSWSKDAQGVCFYHPFTSSRDVLTQAQSIEQGRLPMFALDDYRFDGEVPWNTDPLTKIEVPLTFGKALNYRDEAVAGNIKYLWEPSRHLHIVTLAVAYSSSNDQRHLDAIHRHLNSWFEQCPYPLGPQWVSSLELGIRLINWSIIWGLIGGDDSELFRGESGQAFKVRWLTSIYQHTHFISGYYSGHSSANNHLIGEAAGVYVASKTWPLWPEFEKWGQAAKGILEEQALGQNFSDGVNKEQAISYQQFVLDFLVIPFLIAKKSGDDFSPAYANNIEKMLEYVQSVMDMNGNMPMIGDADDGYVFRLSWGDNFCPYKSLLTTGAVLFKRADFKQAAGAFDDKSALLLGKAARETFLSLKDVKARPKRQSFPEAGYYIMGDHFDSENEYQMVVDAGPLGLGGIAAHGHADALSIWLSVKGVEFLIDPGTYAYHTEKKWRDYFRGTSAHNTIRVDSIDQSEIGGNFMWLQKAESECEEFISEASRDYLRVSHNGYKKLSDSVVHRREFELNKEARQLVVKDSLICEGQHLIEQFWHFNENCQLTVNENCYVAENSGVSMTLQLDDSLDNIQTYTKNEQLPLGWVSRRFDVKEATLTLLCTKKITGSTVLTTIIDL